RGHDYFLGPAPTALDLHAAVTLAVIEPLPEAECPLPAAVRHAFETRDLEVRDAVTPALRAHRALMCERHLVLPVRFCSRRRPGMPRADLYKHTIYTESYEHHARLAGGADGRGSAAARLQVQDGHRRAVADGARPAAAD